MLRLLFAAGFALRLVLALRIPVPANDGAHVLWQAEALARGEFAPAFASVFQPGTALLLAPFVALGLPAHDAARLVLSLLGALFAPAVYLSAKELAPAGGRRAWLAAAAFALLSWRLVRLPGEVYREPGFLAAAGFGLWWLLRGRLRAAALAFGLAFWFREEALAYLALVPLAGGRRGLRAAAAGAAVALTLPGLRALLVGRAALLPALPFVWSEEAGGRALGALFAAHLLALPGAAWRALDGGGLVLGLAGLALCARSSPRPARLLFAGLILHAAAWLALGVKPRYVLSAAPLLLPGVAAALAPAAGAWRRAAWTLALASLGATAVFCGRDLHAPPKRDKLAERALGRHLRALAPPPGSLVTDLPRVAYYAGLRPPPPRAYGPADLRRALARPGVRYAVLGRLRPGRAALAASPPPGFVRRALPPAVRLSPGAERLLWLVRRAPR